MDSSPSPKRVCPKGSTHEQSPLKELDPEQIQQLEEFLDEAAEKFNFSRRVSKKIVKDIITSEESSKLLKVAIGLADPSELPEEKFTRSKAKLTVPLKPVDVSTLGNRPPNFLFVENFGNEEDDADFVVDDEEESEKSSSEESFDEEEEEIQEAAQELATLAEDPNDLLDEKLCPWNPSVQDVNLNSLAIHDDLAETNNELYLQMIQRDWDEAEFENDSDYNYEGEEDEEEESDNWEIFTRKTAVAKREVKFLVSDAYDLDIQNFSESFEETKPKPVKHQWTPKKIPMPDDGSCDLLKDGPKRFKSSELEQLKSQLEQHVQLITQTYVLLYHDENFPYVKQDYQRMFNELCSLSYENEENLQSIYRIFNLNYAYYTFNEIESYPKTSDLHIDWQNAPVSAGFFPRPEACLALMRSNALLYPELVPIVQPHNKKSSQNKWLQSEETLLLFGLLQFGHLPNSSTSFRDGRYYNIQRNLLPTKSEKQIRDHLAVIRRSVGQSEIRKLIIQAETSNPNIRVDRTIPIRLQGISMDLWEEQFKPPWYYPFNKEFIITSDNNILAGCPVRNLLSNDALKRGISFNLKNMKVEVGNLNGVNQPMPITLLPAQQEMIQTAVRKLSQKQDVQTSPIQKKKQCVSPNMRENSMTSLQPELTLIQEEFEDIEDTTDCNPIPFGIEFGLVTDLPPEEQSLNSYEAAEDHVQQPSTSQSQVQSIEAETTALNKRKLRKPRKFIQQKRQRKMINKQKKPIEDHSPGKKKRIEQLKMDLDISSSDSEEDSLLKIGYTDCHQEHENLSSTLRGNHIQIPVEMNFQFQDTSRDMPMLVPLVVNTDFENSYIPPTPGANTPSDCSASPMSYNETDSPPIRPLSSLSEPRTPRDDNVTRSPTLLRVDSVMARSIINKIKVTAKKNLFMGPTDFSSLEKQETMEEKVESFVERSLPYDFSDHYDLSSSDTGLPSTSDVKMNPFPVTQRRKKRTRIERAQDGLEGMNDPEYRRRQEQLLCKHVFADIKKRLLLRRDLYNKIQNIFSESEDPKLIITELYELLHIENPEVFSIISCLFPNDILPIEAYENPIRKTYRDAVDMIMAIDAYTMRAKYKSSKSSKLLFKLVLQFCSKDLSAEEFCEKMKGLFQDAPPLWNFLKSKIALEERPDQHQVELVDMTDQVQVIPQFEFIDISRILGAVPTKRRNKIQNGHIYVSTGNSYVMADIEKPKFAAPVGRAPQSKVHTKKATTSSKQRSPMKTPEQVWTKELDLKIITAYNSIEEENNDAVVDALIPILPFSRERIDDRLTFLLAQFGH